MLGKFKNSNFYKNWSGFFSAFLKPWSFTLIGLSVTSVWLSLKYSDNRPFSTLVTIIAALFAGLAGAFIKDDFSNLMLEKKGRSAIRNLNSIGNQIIQIRGWIKFFITQKKRDSKNSLEEIDRHLSTTEIHIKSGLEDWVDIIPELKKEEEVVKNYQDVIKSYLDELLKNKKELLSAGGNQELKERLEKKIKELEKNVRELKKEQPRIFSGGSVGSSFVVGPDSFISAGGGGIFNGLNNKVCSECGKSYSEDLLLTSPYILNRNLCPECRKKYNVGV